MNKSSEKSFGLLFSFVFLIVALWPLLSSNNIRFWSLIISFAFLLVSFIRPTILKPLNNLWIKLGELLGKIIAPIVMALVYFVVLTPISLIVRIFGKDLLGLKLLKKTKSYWIERKKDLGSMKKQF